MKQIAQLTPEQIELAWTFAKPIPNEDPNKVRQDFLGARIYKNKYNVDDPYGWVAEYVLNHNFLRDHSNTDEDIFCEANVRVLFIGNYEKNKNYKIGYYEGAYMDECEVNRKQYVCAVYHLSPFGKEELQKTYGLTDDSMNLLSN
mgnify:CR=1 FL=1